MSRRQSYFANWPETCEAMQQTLVANTASKITRGKKRECENEGSEKQWRAACLLSRCIKAISLRRARREMCLACCCIDDHSVAAKPDAPSAASASSFASSARSSKHDRQSRSSARRPEVMAAKCFVTTTLYWGTIRRARHHQGRAVGGDSIGAKWRHREKLWHARSAVKCRDSRRGNGILAAAVAMCGLPLGPVNVGAMAIHAPRSDARLPGIACVALKRGHAL